MGEFGTAKWTDYDFDDDGRLVLIEVIGKTGVYVEDLDITMEDVKNGYIEDEKMEELKQVIWDRIENNTNIFGLDYECELVEYFGGDLEDR